MRRDDGGYVQVKAVWHLPRRKRQNLSRIAGDFAGEIWIVEFDRDLSVREVRTGLRRKRLCVRDATSGAAVEGWQPAAELLGLVA